jgi:cyclopropane fatty-acyl-phospholipid synthase-like methyltransferase
MPTDLRKAYEDLTYLSPMSDARARGLVDFLTAGPIGTVVDYGCGWAELLLQTLEAAPGARGVGVDAEQLWLDHARARARARGVADRVDLRLGDAASDGPDRADAAICIGSSQIWGAAVTDNLPLDYTGALDALRVKLPRGGRLVFGEAIWTTGPTPAAAAPLSGRLDEFITLSELVELTVAHGFAPVAVGQATLQEWDEFESGFTARYAHWLASHDADHPDAAAIRNRAERQRTGYLSGYRGVLGMAYLCLLAC